MVENDFSYKVRDDDKSRQELKYKEDFFGYEHVEPTIFSKDIIDLRDEIINEKELMNYLEFNEGIVNSWYLRKKNKLWDELGINLQKIQFIKPNFDLGEDGYLGKTISDFYGGLIYDYPTELPISFIEDYLRTSFLAEYLEFTNHVSIIFKCIYLPMVEREICSCIYAHELTHIELENVGGGITKKTNEETLPILVELLYANKYNKDTEDKILNHRLIYMAGAITKLLKDKDINFEQRIKLETYLISILQGISLFNKYKDGNDNTKKEIIDYINKIFVGEKLVEDMLNKYDSNYQDIKPKFKVLKKN